MVVLLLLFLILLFICCYGCISIVVVVGIAIVDIVIIVVVIIVGVCARGASGNVWRLGRQDSNGGQQRMAGWGEGGGHLQLQDAHLHPRVAECLGAERVQPGWRGRAAPLVEHRCGFGARGKRRGGRNQRQMREYRESGQRGG